MAKRFTQPLTILSIALVVSFSNVFAQDARQLLPAPVAGGVGFSRLDAVDYERTFMDEASRPIAVSLWYPSDASSGSEMRLETYVELHQDADSLGVLPFLGWAARSSTDTSKVAAILASPVSARLRATPAGGRYPLILYASSFRAPAYENFALFEYLAGLGFVVAAIPSVGQDASGMSMDAVGMRAQLADFELALERTLELPYVDPFRIGTMGFSLGAAPAAILAMDTAEVRAMVSIDGAFNYTYTLLDRHATPARTLDAAFLQLTQRSAPAIQLDNTFFGQNAAGPSYHLQWRGLDHYDFGSLTALLRAARPADYRPSDRQIAVNGVNSTSAEERIRMYREVVGTIGDFFEAHLQDSAVSRRTLEARIDEPDHAEWYSTRDRK